jgi:hypothetical protein
MTQAEKKEFYKKYEAPPQWRDDRADEKGSYDELHMDSRQISVRAEDFLTETSSGYVPTIKHIMVWGGSEVGWLKMFMSSVTGPFVIHNGKHHKTWEEAAFESIKKTKQYEDSCLKDEF